jgi:hypothetical protein
MRLWQRCCLLLQACFADTSCILAGSCLVCAEWPRTGNGHSLRPEHSSGGVGGKATGQGLWVTIAVSALGGIGMKYAAIVVGTEDVGNFDVSLRSIILSC